jgi:hypothetical protein
MLFPRSIDKYVGYLHLLKEEKEEKREIFRKCFFGANAGFCWKRRCLHFLQQKRLIQLTVSATTGVIVNPVKVEPWIA